MRNSLCFHNAAPTHVEQAKQQPGDPAWRFGQTSAGSEWAHALCGLEHRGHLTCMGAPSRAGLITACCPGLLPTALGLWPNSCKRWPKGQCGGYVVNGILRIFYIWQAVSLSGGTASFSKRYGKAWSPLTGLEGLDPFCTLKRFAFWVPKEINHCILDTWNAFVPPQE